MERNIRIEVIDSNSPHLEAVITLGRTNAKTLGQMPQGAFLDYAANKCVVVALSPEEQCVGYLMYRISKHIACIAHLCVDKDWRGKHVAKQLINHLIEETKELDGIKLSCRRDYGLDKMWSSFGFTPRSEKPGRNKAGKLLTIWFLEHKRPKLLTLLAEQAIGTKLCAAIDTNVFFDLDEDNTNRQVEDSKSLAADWLQSEVELCLTDEIDIEINRCADEIQRKKLRAFASNFTRLSCSHEEFQITCQALEQYFFECCGRMAENEASDMRHLARAIAAKVQFFITRDRGILDKEDLIYTKFNVLILRPSDLIIRLDELCREVDYQPIRLAGTSIEKRLVQAGQQKKLADSFLSYKNGETLSEFQHQLQRAIADPNCFECYVVRDEQEDPLAFIIYSRQLPYELKIPMFRIRRNYKFSQTVISHLILLSIKIAAKENRQFTRITDEYLDESTVQTLIKDCFIRVENEWLRANLAVVKTALELSNYLTQLPSELETKFMKEESHFSNTFKKQDYSFCQQFATALSELTTIKDARLTTEIERCLYPAKIIDAEIPCFIIPIQPQWAENLFDEHLARQNIFGANKEIALRREVVYYRSKLNSGELKAPGRILWYVSQNKKVKGYYQVQSIRACSRLDEIIIDTPKNLFRQFKRLGVYEFKNVFETANKDLNNQIMAVRFSDTELFSNPVPFK
ncbi:GNAT family N-acetyltransferase [Aliterella atlantica]|uniref:GNAT family N-acetyltransferase n=1 Tax=Aliterella atlantica TaxID=1827278 RepID=UPI000697CBB7|nr:GNAT family N-acetyltransferase [Aliterella atlantica]